MSYGKDKTLLDNNRTLLNLHRAEVENVLPSHFAEEYPKLIQLFEEYYKWLDSDTNPGGQIKRLYASRDATQVPEPLLEQLEDELLLGQSYFGGFLNKREAIKFSNTLYRSKGTKYSIEQFFRAFYGVDPQIIYPKDNVFTVGPAIDEELSTTNSDGQQVTKEASIIGPESNRYLTDDKLYQVLSILIRTSIPRSQWEEVYKLFVHPAGMYLGSEILLEAINLAWDDFEHDRERENNGGINTIQVDRGELIPEFILLEGTATAEVFAYPSLTLLSNGDSDTQPVIRQDVDIYLNRTTIRSTNTTIEKLSTGYDYRDLISPNSLRFDDSDIGGSIVSAGEFSQRGYTYSDISNEILRLAVGLPVSDSDYSFLTDSDGNGVIIADVDNSGTVNASDALAVAAFGEGEITSGAISAWIDTHISPRISPNILLNTFDQHVFDTQYDSARS